MEIVDQTILFMINGNHCAYFDAVMSLISSKWIWVPMYLCILVELWRRLRFSWLLLLALVTIGVTFFVTDFCCSQIIRPLFPRFRPVSVENPIHEMVNAVEGYRHNSYGFPSCHASNTMGLATLMWLMFRNKLTTSVMFFWAIVTCYSRVYLGVHYPGDVLVGSIIGFTVGCLMYRLCCCASKRLGLQVNTQESLLIERREKTPWLIPAVNISIFLIIIVACFLH